MDNKISFIAGYILTAATTITAAGLLNAIVLGLLGGFFGIIGKEAYLYTRDQIKIAKPKASTWWFKLKSKIGSWWINLKIKSSAWIASKIEWIKSKF